MNALPNQPLLASAQRQIRLFHAIRWRNRFTRFLYPASIPRHENLMRWAISKAAQYCPEAPYLSELSQQIALFAQPYDQALPAPKIIALRQEAFALSLVLPVIYREIQTNPPAWIAHFIEIDTPSRGLIDRLTRQGGLVLTAHCFFHHMLGAVLGGLGCKVYGVAAPLGIGEDWPIIGPLTTAVNLGSERLFGGGRYLYIDEPKTLMRDIEMARSSRATIIGLLDHGDQKSSAFTNILGWKFGIQTPLIRRWADRQDPIYFGLVWPKIGNQGALIPRWQLRISVLKDSAATDAQTIIDAYARELEQWVLAFPWAWQGFRWTQSFPRAL